MSDAVADFIRRNYSCDGLEVRSARARPSGALLTAFKVTRQGKDHVVVAAPPELTDLTELLKQLETDFDVVADLHYRNRTVELILHTSPPAKSYANGSIWGIFGTVILAGAYMAATRFQLESLQALW